MFRKALVWISCLMVMLALNVPVLAEGGSSDHEHSWGPWATNYEATCADEGEEERTCSICHDTETRVIPTNNHHDWSDWSVVKAPTVNTRGKKSAFCYTCDKKQTKSTPKLKAYVKLSKKTLTIKAGKSYKFKVKYAKGDRVKSWKSSNKKVASISKNGKLVAKKSGIAKISVVTKSGKKAICTVKVKKAVKKQTSKRKKSSKQGRKSSNSTVYWTPSGKVYHVSRGCPTLSRSRTVHSGSVGESRKSRVCSVCGH